LTLRFILKVLIASGKILANRIKIFGEKMFHFIQYSHFSTILKIKPARMFMHQLKQRNLKLAGFMDITEG